VTKKWRVFRARKAAVNLPAFTSDPLTNSPSKHHVLPLVSISAQT
jgi:hypothetical protein